MKAYAQPRYTEGQKKLTWSSQVAGLEAEVPTTYGVAGVPSGTSGAIAATSGWTITLVAGGVFARTGVESHTLGELT